MAAVIGGMALIASAAAIPLEAAAEPETSASDDYCVLWKGGIADENGKPISNGKVAAYVQPSPETVKGVPDGGRFEIPLADTATTNLIGQYTLTVPKADFTSYLVGNSSFNFYVVGSDDDSSGARYLKRKSDCIGTWPNSAEPLTLDKELSTAKTRSAESNEDSNPYDPFCSRTDLGDQLVEVGRAYNVSDGYNTTDGGAVVNFQYLTGGTSRVGAATSIGVDGVFTWNMGAEREYMSNLELDMLPLTSEAGAAAFRSEFEFVDLECKLFPDPYGSVGEYVTMKTVQPVDFSSGTDAVKLTGPHPEFPAENCTKFDNGFTMTNGSATRLTSSLDIAGDYAGVSVSSQTGYSDYENIVLVNPKTKDGKYTVPVMGCGLDDDLGSDPGLVKIKDKPLEFGGFSYGNYELCLKEAEERYADGQIFAWDCRYSGNAFYLYIIPNPLAS